MSTGTATSTRTACPGGERHPAEGLELPHRPHHRGDQVADVELRDGHARPLPGVADGEGHSQLAAGVVSPARAPAPGRGTRAGCRPEPVAEGVAAAEVEGDRRAGALQLVVVVVGQPRPTLRGKESGSRPEGSTAPVSTSASAVPPSWPPANAQTQRGHLVLQAAQDVGAAAGQHHHHRRAGRHHRLGAAPAARPAGRGCRRRSPRPPCRSGRGRPGRRRRPRARSAPRAHSTASGMSAVLRETGERRSGASAPASTSPGKTGAPASRFSRMWHPRA